MLTERQRRLTHCLPQIISDKNNHCEQDFMQATQAYAHLQSLKVK